MTSPESIDRPLAETDSAWQWSLRDQFTLVLVCCVMLTLIRVFEGAVGLAELASLAIATISAFTVGFYKRFGCLWLAGPLLLLIPGMLLFTPIPFMTRLGLGALSAGVYILAAIPIVCATKTAGKLWPWMVGSIACFAVAMLITPPDPISMLFVVLPLFICYIIVAIAWRVQRSALRVIGPVLTVTAMIAILAGYLAAVLMDGSNAAAATPNGELSIPHELVNLDGRIFAPLGLLGAAVTIVAYGRNRSAR